MTHAGYNRIIEPNIQSNMKLRNPNNSDQKHVSETHLSSLIITATQQQQQRQRRKQAVSDSESVGNGTARKTASVMQ
jgi:hypothetical protein